MSRDLLVLLILLLTALIAGLRLYRNARRNRRAGNAYPRRWRTAMLILLQPMVGAALYLTLFPPHHSVPVAELTVYSGDATATKSTNAVALPDAPERIDTPRVPDLSTALRQHPGTQRIHVVGNGLPTRDQGAARDVIVRFTPSPQPRGVTELNAPSWVAAGQSWQLRGTASDLARGSVALIDPAGATVASAAIAENGQFELWATSRSIGRVLFTLNVTDATQEPLQQLTVPLATLAGDPLRVAIIAGGVNPEFKYLRRWAIDAGLQLGGRLTMSRNSNVVDHPVTLSVAALREWDLLLLDDRAWYGLRDSERSAIQEAIRGGLGLLLRFTAEPGSREQALLAPLGFAIDSASMSRGVHLAPMVTSDRKQALESTTSPRNPELSRRALRVAGANAQALLRSSSNDTLATWRPLGRGRVALWWLTDSYRLVLAGQGPRHADLWSRAVERIARARGEHEPQFRNRHAWLGQRIVVCGSGDMRVATPDGVEVPLIVDPASEPGCAGYWPRQMGWHALDANGKQWPFFVRDAGQDMALRQAQNRAETAQLAASRAVGGDDITTQKPIPRWQPFLLWLLAASLLWMLERSHLGMTPDRVPSV